ncbi:MAG TPA: LacI family DNA-binding transcriptional regulator [Armatimonadota bacterium]|jgi:DNA-binding LacI/PurR family transcriptional regulator
MKPLTQKKIAELASVSQPTVSRVLGGDAGVDPAARDRIMDIVKRNGYQPHAQARSLRRQRSDTIGLAVRRTRQDFAKDPFYAELITAVMDRAAHQGYYLSISASRSADGERLFYDSLFASNRVDGLIILESLEHDERIERLRDHRFPFVLIGRYDGSPDLFSVNNDNIGGAAMVVRHLLERGRKRIGYVSGPHDLTVSQDRLIGYRQGLEDAGIRYDRDLVVEADFGEQGGRSAAHRLLDQQPDAILAIDDLIGLGALVSIKERGLRVPDDVALVGFNDSLFCPHTDPPLSSVSVNVNEIGAKAADLLIQRIEKKDTPPCQLLVPCELVARASS